MKRYMWEILFVQVYTCQTWMIKQLYSALIVRMYYKHTALIPHQVTAKIVAAMNGHEGLRATDMKREAGNKLDYEAFSGAAAELPRVKQVTNWIQGRRPRLWVSYGEAA